ncbi:hypothetical protein BZL30_7866 [Mycobacterium kansasii]|uniref:Uncharacterized protein n=1 Tax=Mycobacterium kansasii TaxID=1768 RepID=A0A1V3WKR8_MYCKA|nr:hypothetical protein BZL30_7866 [Mycobacterium kansasii]
MACGTPGPRVNVGRRELAPWTHQVHLTGTRVAPGSAREKVW